MCGIAGFVYFDRARPAPGSLARAMADALDHRGPDASGTHVDGPAALGHARLSIIDLSAEANQPMLSPDGALAIAFNGEVYNFRQLGEQLRREGVTLRTRSDTEVVLELYRRRGLAFANELRGMFAIAIWDRAARRLVLVRDRVGQKPLFYYQDGEHLSFASEVRALLLDESLEPRVDCEGLSLYLSLGYVPSCASAFAGVRKVQPGSMVIVEDGAVRERRYWKLEYGEPRRAPVADEVRALRDKLADAVRARMISDVPLGAFLSGGLDSSTIVALMAQASDRPVKTFSIGFEDEDFSELEHARAVAAHYHTEHYEEIVRPDAVALLPRLVEQYGEPFADPSAVPTYCLSRMTRQHVTVALSGDGADETFAGYTRYAHERGARVYERLPRALVQPLAETVARALPHLAGPGGSRRTRVAEAMALVRQRARRIQLSPAARYVAEFGNLHPAALEPLLASGTPLDARRAERLFERVWSESSARNAVDRLLDLDSRTYLPDDIFVKVDIAAMASSLEVRSPMVDHLVLEHAARLAGPLKLFGFRGKRVLRLVAQKLLPPSVVRRRKKGFTIPHSRWLRGDLQSMAHDTLLSARCLGRGYFDAAALRRMVDEHDRGTHDHGLRLWNLLWLELWHRRFIDASSERAVAAA